MSKYNSISIREAMENIATSKYLLPAIQRKFVWNTAQIEMLFDSIMRGYPINSFMLWKISDPTLKYNYQFYKFIQNYVDKFSENNSPASTKFLWDEFYAIVDGQQRLNSLFIGLTGTYRYKKPNKHWVMNEENMPVRRLYLDISKPIDTAIDNEKWYNFRFLSKSELNDATADEHWFEVGKIIELENLAGVSQYLLKNNLIDNAFAMETLSTLISRIFNEELINYYVIDDQNQDAVLDVFLRTNQGGTKLSFSDLLMSIASANWEKFDARSEIASIKEEIYSFGNPRFDVTQDFVLKSILVLSDSDIRFKLENFGREHVKGFEEHWPEMRQSLVATFNLLEQLGFNDSTLRAKNAAIPIAYYIYKNGNAKEIVKTTYSEEEKKKIAKWLTLSLLKGMFGGHSDGTLSKMRETIKNMTGSGFPMQELFDAFKTDIDRNYSFDDEIIRSLLFEQYKSSTAELVLMLLYPDVVIKHGKTIAEDHMHPKAFFENADNIDDLDIAEDARECYEKRFYNSVINLQLLEELENKSKGDTSLLDWAKAKGKTNKDLYIEDDISLNINNFDAFVESRLNVLQSKLKALVQ